MKKIVYLFATGAIFAANPASAQTVDDALRFSRVNVLGTARYTSMGGAFGALGGDFSVTSSNPAGLAVYRKSEFTVTPGLFFNNSTSQFNNNQSNAGGTNFAFGNLGVVGTRILPETGGGWVSTSWAFGYNRVSNLKNDFLISGRNNRSSLLDVFVDRVDAGSFDDFNEGLAVDAGLIFFDSLTMSYQNDIPGGGINGINQRRAISSSGGIGETVFSYAGNYDHRLYLGGTITFANIRHRYTSNHYEQPIDDPGNFLNEYTFVENVNTRGRGINLKLGLLYRATDWLRMGMSLHTPTIYSMRDTYSSEITSVFNAPIADLSGTYFSPSGRFNYDFTSPLRAMGSLGFILAKQGLIGVDYEFTDYSKAMFGSTEFPGFVNQVNNEIRDLYTASHNIRVGAEYRIDPFALRAGYNFLSNPYKFNNGAIQNVSVGFGFRDEDIFFDLAYSISILDNNNFHMYNPAYIDPASLSFRKSTILATIGFRF